MRLVTQSEVITAAQAARDQLWDPGMLPVTLWGVPRGGVPAALALAAVWPTPCALVDDPSAASYIVDDIWDSGATAARYANSHPHSPFIALFDKRRPEWANQWLVMPWEVSDADASADDAIVRLLQYIGEDPTREGLRDTPRRVLKAWRETWAAGYSQSPADVLKVFEDGAEGVDEMVVQRGIPVHSMCEHHMAPFTGTATIGYVPDGRIVGLSKLVRLVNIFARRLQVQERLTTQIADALMEHLAPKGVGVIIECEHFCMRTRGVSVVGVPTTTSALRGVLFSDPRARAEFLRLG